jgi:pimeloyl-ACP methyl ester carboxylesterase
MPSTIRTLALALSLLAPAALHAQTKSTHFAPFQNIKLHYDTYGHGTTTVVLVHGWACDTEFWRDQIPALAAHWRVVAVDLPGFGQSDKPHVDYTPAYLAQGLAAILDDAHVTRAYVVGHSMGGSVVRQYAQDHPDHVAALVIVDSRSLLQGEGLSRPYAERAHLVDELYGPNSQAEARSDIQLMFTDQTPPALQHEIMAKMLATPQYVAASAMKGLLTPVTWSKYPETIPTLGLYRTPLTPAAVAGFKAMFPNMDLHMYPGAGHFLMLEQPEKVNAQLITFLRQQDKP